MTLRRGRSASQVLAALVAGALALAALPGSASATQGAAAAAGTARYFGAWAQPAAGQSRIQALSAQESRLGTRLPLVTDYAAWDEAFPSSLDKTVATRGSHLLLFVKLKRKDGSRPKWIDLANAKKGSALYADMDRWAAGLKSYGKPMHLVFHKEPNEPANQANGTAPQYVAAYRAFVAHMRTAGVGNVRYVWALPATIFANASQASSWYPGDSYVDVIGGTGANHYGCLPGIAPKWRTFAAVFAAMRTWASAHPTRRTGAVEFETVEDPAQAGRKAQWISDAHSVVGTSGWSQIEVLSYFNSTATDGGGVCDWRLTTSSSALSAAAAWANDPRYGG